MKTISFRIATALLGMAAIIVMGALPAQAMLTVKANHDHIKVDYNYHGSTVSVKGEADPDVDLVIKIAAPEGEQALMRKDKVGGVLWMNVEKLEFENVPGVYFLKGTASPEDILSEKAKEDYRIGYGALERAAEISPAMEEQRRHELFGQFLKYKEAGKVYSASKSDIELRKGDGVQEYSTVFQWPFQAPPGKYDVSVYAVKAGDVVESAQSQVLVEQAGAVKLLSDMAMKNGAVYGIVAIAIALAAGFGVGMVFGKGGGAH